MNYIKNYANNIGSWKLIKYFFILFYVFFYLPNKCWAGSFQVNPVKIELSEKTPTAVLNIENTSSNDTSIQIKTMAWSQSEGKDRLEITREILVAPKIFKLKAGSTQIVRIGKVINVDKNEELSYRLSIEEIPSPLSSDFKGLQVALRINIPLFIEPIEKSMQKINFSNFRFLNKNLIFDIKNNGLIHSKINSIKIFSESNPEAVLGLLELPTYFLPKSEKSIEIKIDQNINKNSSKLKIKAQTLTGVIESDVILSNP